MSLIQYQYLYSSKIEVLATVSMSQLQYNCLRYSLCYSNVPPYKKVCVTQRSPVKTLSKWNKVLQFSVWLGFWMQSMAMSSLLPATLLAQHLYAPESRWQLEFLIISVPLSSIFKKKLSPFEKKLRKRLNIAFTPWIYPWCKCNMIYQTYLLHQRLKIINKI